MSGTSDKKYRELEKRLQETEEIIGYLLKTNQGLGSALIAVAIRSAITKLRLTSFVDKVPEEVRAHIMKEVELELKLLIESGFDRSEVAAFFETEIDRQLIHR